MKIFKAFIMVVILATAIALFQGFIKLDAAALASESCVTANCHPSMLKSKNIHPIAYTCDSCHQPTGEPHPQKGKKTFALMQEGSALCSMCHPNVGTKKNIHSPVKDGMCTTCHSPHESEEPKLLLQPTGSLCSMCHPDKMAHKYLHGPTAAGDCTACHAPHDSENKALILKDGAELCLTCHIDIQGEMKKKVVHSALLGGCTSCHSPHGSQFKKFFASEGDKLCFQCHPAIQEGIGKAKSLHAPIKTEKACASCHAPHASEGDNLLVKTEKDLCLDCHKGFIKKKQTVLHGPINEGKCSPCHNPHSSLHDKLLIKRYSTEDYIPYTDKEYELCFACHNREMFRFPETSFATGFRDGDKNLHFIHVNRKDKGRNCKLCHAIHGGALPKLIADTVSFGKWQLPLKFIKTDTGGSCTPGCHRQFHYDRKTPGKAPEIEKAADKTNDKDKKKKK
jgi:predicted CXXCH cytochrome family protein